LKKEKEDPTEFYNKNLLVPSYPYFCVVRVLSIECASYVT